jgi:phage terminase large subunit-like protein
VTPVWSTACPDWETRIVEGRSLIPFRPLFPEEAEAALAVFRELRLVDVAGSPTMGEACRPWVFDFVGAIFGAYDQAAGRRLIRNFFLSISKKNMKSTLAAGIMLTALIRNWRLLNELIILAPTIEVAQNSFVPARGMIRASEELTALLHVQPSIRTITHRGTDATLKIVAADTQIVGGKKAAFVLVDELWQFGRRADAEDMLREATGGLAARPEGSVTYLTTQSDGPPAGVFAKTQEYFRKVRDGLITDPRSLSMIYEFPPAMVKAEAYRDPANWYITNPNLGASVDEEFLRDRYAIDQVGGESSLRGFFAKHLNVQVGTALAVDNWVGAQYW